jgi:hypothetical protein
MPWWGWSIGRATACFWVPSTSPPNALALAGLGGGDPRAARHSLHHAHGLKTPLCGATRALSAVQEAGSRQRDNK